MGVTTAQASGGGKAMRGARQAAGKATRAIGWGMVLLVAGCSSAKQGKGGATAPAVAAIAPPAGTLGAAELDRLIEESWRAAKVRISPPADDLEFLRRVTLDLVGRAPSLLEVKAFLADTQPDRRARRVDRLLASPEFGEHWADLYANLLWHEDGKNKVERRADPRGWFVRAFNENLGYDHLSLAVVAGQGDVREHGALGFVASRIKAGGAEALTGAAARVFLGLQIQCAQCHDHPYDTRWKQEDFWGLAAYFAGTRVRQEESMSMEGGGKTFIVRDGKGKARMQRPGAADEVVVKPRFLGYQPVERAADSSLRRTFARAMIASDLFPKAMVGRTWAHLFGHGIVDPWDDLGAEMDSRHPALLVKLAEDFRAGGYDIKRLIRQIVLSTAYARSSAPPPGAPEDPETMAAAVRAFARAGVRPLTPEQLFRTLKTATGAEVMVRNRARTEERAEKMLAQALREYRFAFDDDEMAEPNRFDGSMPQALLLWNGELTNGGARVGAEGVLGGILRSRAAPADRVEDMLLAAYTRRPTAEEAAFFLEHLKGGRGRDERRAYEDLYFALLTSTEAVTNH
jgi:hypothetical protein